MKSLLAAILTLLLPGVLAGLQGNAAPATIFKVRRASEHQVYLDAGSSAGLAPGMSLTIRRKGVYNASSGVGEIKADVIVARITVVNVSSSSATCEIEVRNLDIQPGDSAHLAGPQDKNFAPLFSAHSEPVSQPDSSPSEQKSLAELVRENRAKRQGPARSTTGTAAALAAPAPVSTVPAIASAPAMSATPAGPSAPAAPASATTVASVPPPPPVIRPVTAPVATAAPLQATTAVQKTSATEGPVVSARAAISPAPTGPTAPRTPERVAFTVKYVAQDAVYIDGGKNAGLTEGMILSIQRAGATAAPGNSDPVADGKNVDSKVLDVAELAVVSVSSSSAVCEIKQKTEDIQRGDVAMLSGADQEKMVQMRTLMPDRKYPQVIAFTEGDPLDEEVRESVPRPPLPEVNRTRGRIGVDYSAIRSSVAGAGGASSSQGGGVIRIDMTRIGGSYWNLNGYWRGRMNLRNSSAQPQTVYDLVNRTYTIGLTYVNPESHWVAGVGRLYLPWATSLDTNDGGYLARRIGSHVALGVFGGTAPDPTSFDYNPNRQTGGTFIAFEGGSFDNVRFTSTEGVAVTGIDLREDRQFVFSENGLFFKRFLSIYHSAQADRQRMPLGGTTEGLSRSFATIRIQPFSRLSFDVNHNYFRDVPTFDPLLVSTGLLDKFLFQGFSAGARLDLPWHISVYNNFGQSNRSGDTHNSFNQLYGVTIGRLWKTGIRGDVRYSQFDSSFGRGDYRALALSRSFHELLRVEVTAGKQSFISSLGTPTDYQLIGTTMDWNLGRSYFFESGFNWQKGTQQTFEQWFMTVGYRFDSRRTK